MGFTFTFKKDLNLAIIELHGDIHFLQEINIFSSILLDTRIKENVRILFDRSKAPILTNPETVNYFIETVTGQLKAIGRPRIAVVVADKVDYGIARMLDLHNQPPRTYDMHVFFERTHAFRWLGINAREFMLF